MYESFKNFYERPCYCTNWPDSFDFETDEICQTIFKPFIEKQLEELKTYDAQRPKDITYIFHEHAKRVANDIKSTCLHMNLTNNVANNMYWALLPHDIGKKNLPLAIWDTKDQPTGDMKAQRRTHTIVGAQFAEERFKDINHPFKTLMIDIMLHHHEQMNGAGTLGIPARKLSNPVRLAAIVEAYDGWRIWRPHFGDRNISNTGVLNRMREEKAAAFFDMRLFESFADMKMEEYKQKQEA
jgi:HD-GYP domain-containing protein (c-di-GMP phosphodiesterase class II)